MATTATHSPGEKLSIFALATAVLFALLAVAFAGGWLIGRMLA